MAVIYELLKAAHILASIIWLGGALMLILLGVRARRQGPAQLVPIFRKAAKVAPRTFVPVSLVLVLVGFALLGMGKLPFAPWVILGIVGWAITFVTGIAVLTPNVKKTESPLGAAGAALRGRARAGPASAHAHADRPSRPDADRVRM